MKVLVAILLLLAAPAFAALFYYELHPTLMWTPENQARADRFQATIGLRAPPRGTMRR